jgi:hypothetical protein
LKEEVEMRRVGILLAALALGAGLSGLAGAADSKAPAKKPAAKSGWKIWAAPDIKFVDVEGMKGAQMALLWGDMKKGPYGVLFKWASGFDAGWHTHSHPLRDVVAQGTFTLETESSGGVKELGPGSYIDNPAKSRHRSGCKAGEAECVFLVTQSAAFDLIPDEKK